MKHYLYLLAFILFSCSPPQEQITYEVNSEHEDASPLLDKSTINLTAFESQGYYALTNEHLRLANSRNLYSASDVAFKQKQIIDQLSSLGLSDGLEIDGIYGPLTHRLCLEIETFDKNSHFYDVKYIVIHSLGSRDGLCWDADDLNRNWSLRNFSRPGYHVVINPTQECGVIWQGYWNGCQISETQRRWGVRGRDEDGVRINNHAIHIAWVGGFSGEDTRTEYQKKMLYLIYNVIKMSCPDVRVKGHNEMPGVAKSCPNFDVTKEFG
jgi:N-acetylmuramoyl-L-alanine amidase